MYPNLARQQYSEEAFTSLLEDVEYALQDWFSGLTAGQVQIEGFPEGLLLLLLLLWVGVC